MSAEGSGLTELKVAPQIFSASIGLTANYHTSSLIPVNVHDFEIARLAAVLGCKVGFMPFTRLGLPVGTTKPTIQVLMRIVDRIQGRLGSSSLFLNYGSHLELQRFSSMPIYFLCSLQLPLGIIKQLERIERQCLWSRNEGTPWQSLIAWDLVCRPKDKGGPEIINPRIKHLFKFYNKADVP